MNSKLEERLYLYERDHPIHSDQDLLAALEAILDEQDSFPVEQKDFDLISEATEFALHLQGYSDEQLTEMSNASGKRILDRIHEKSIPAKRRTPKSRRTRLAWIILVAIVGTIAITSVSASVSGINILSATKQFIVNLVNRSSTSIDNQEYATSSNHIIFNSIDELANKYPDKYLLLPTPSEDLIVTEITSTLYENELSIYISTLLPSSDSSATIVVINNTENQDLTTPNALLGDKNVFLSSSNGDNQCEFLDDYYNHYIIRSQSLDTIITIINSLEVKK